MTGEQDVTKRFEPKTPIQLNPPKDDPIKLDYLEKCDGKLQALYTSMQRFAIIHLA